MFHGNSCKLILVPLLLSVLGSSSAPKPDAATDPTGTWTWAMQRQNGGGREVTAKFKQQGEKVSGTVSGMGFGGGGEIEITDGTIKDGVITFKVIRTRNGQDSVSIYSGKLQGDAIKGKAEIEMRGQKITRNWEAQRVKEEPAKQD